MKPVCLFIGAGAGIGGNAGKRFAREGGWRLATFAPFRTAAAVRPLMEQRGKGTILVTSAMAAVRGNRGQHSSEGVKA